MVIASRQAGKLFAGLAALVLLALGNRTPVASAVELPPNAVSEDTFFLLRFDAPKVDANTLRATAKAFLGEQAGAADEGLKEYESKHTALVQAGVQSGMMLVTGADPSKATPAVYFATKDGADDEQIKKLLTEKMKDSDRSKTVFAREGGYLVMREKSGPDAPAPVAAPASPEKARLFADALAGAGDKAIIGVFVPNAAIKAEIQKEAQNPGSQIAPVAPALLESKYLVLTGTLGENASFTIALYAASPEAAKQVGDQLTQVSAQLKQAAQQMAQGPMAAQAGMMNALADILTPAQDGARVSLTITAKNAGPAIANLLPFIMANMNSNKPAVSQPAPGGNQ